jgi:YbbR domain-containing protein
MIKILRRVFLRNWGLKLFSFLVAFILWLVLIPEEKTFAEKNLTVSLELYNIPPGMDVVGKPPSTVDVKIRAPESLIGQITPANVRAVLDLRNARPDVENYVLNESMISAPPGAEIKEVRPRQVSLKLERTVALMLDVEPHIIGKLREGLGVAKIEVVPRQVLVRGPESKINQKEKVRTTPVDLTPLTQSTEIEANLILPNADLQFASAQTAVRVKILIQEDKTEEKPPVKKK